jgi:hypothetical protein
MPHVQRVSSSYAPGKVAVVLRFDTYEPIDRYSTPMLPWVLAWDAREDQGEDAQPEHGLEKAKGDRNANAAVAEAVKSEMKMATGWRLLE